MKPGWTCKSPPGLNLAMKLSDFEHTLKRSDQPVIVDLWAPWCGPCRTTKPILEKLAVEYEGRVDFLAVNADEASEITRQFRVFAIPTVLSFWNGKLIGRATGAQGESNYRKMFEAALHGETPQLQLSTFNRLLRVGAGLALIGVAFLASNWVLAVAGGVVAFMGVYDRCPIFRAITDWISAR